MASGELKGFLAAVASALALSTMGVLGKFAFAEGMHPINLVALRAVLAFAVLGSALVLVRGRLPSTEGRDLRLFILLGFVGIALNYAAFFLALKHGNVSTAISLLYTYPAFVLLGAVLFLGEQLTAAKLAALALSLAGCFLVTGAYDPARLQLAWLGVAFGLVASLTKAIYTLLSKRLLGRYDPLSTVFFAFGFGALFLLLYAGGTGELRFDIGGKAWLLVAAIAIVPTLIGYSLFVLSLKYMDASRASLVATLEPVAAILLAMIILNEWSGWPEYLGMALIVCALALIQISAIRSAKRREA